MKKAIAIPKKYLYLIYSFFVLTFLITGFVLVKNHISFQEKMEKLYLKEIKGVVIEMKDESRGLYFISVKNGVEIFEIHDLLFGREIKKYNIQIGDSIYKYPNSRNMIFFKINNQKFVRVCELEM